MPGSDINIQSLINMIVSNGSRVNLINKYSHQLSLISYPTNIYTLMTIDQCLQMDTASAMPIGQYLKIFFTIGSKGLKLEMALLLVIYFLKRLVRYGHRSWIIRIFQLQNSVWDGSIILSSSIMFECGNSMERLHQLINQLLKK